MRRACIIGICGDKVGFICSCLNNNEYFCTRHSEKHKKEVSGHTIIPWKIKLNNVGNQKIKQDALKSIKLLKDLRKELKWSAFQIINKIEVNLSQLLTNIRNQEILIHDLVYAKASTNKSLDRRIYENTLKFASKDKIFDFTSINNIKKEIDLSFKIDFYVDLFLDCEEVIFSNNFNTGGLLSLNLTNLQLSTLDYAPNIGAFCQCCKIDKSTYYFNKGRLHKGTNQGKGYKINILQRKYEELPMGPIKDFAGSIYKDNKIYIIGGWNSLPLNTCETFNLITNEWKPIHNLPQASCCITAALFNNNIVFSGLELNCVYYYNDSVYLNILDLPENSCKVVCDGWVLANSYLYEYIVDNWIKYHLERQLKNGVLAYTTFKKNEYIYFIDTNSMLMRINTNAKTLENIPFKKNNIIL